MQIKAGGQGWGWRPEQGTGVDKHKYPSHVQRNWQRVYT